MIRYALVCAAEHGFDAWFPDSDSCDRQLKERLVECPECGSTEVRKQIMAPSVATRGAADADSGREARARVAEAVREHIRSTHEFVGERFADEARAMHRGETESKPIYGEASADEARALREEGAPVAPIPPAFAPKPPKKLN